MGKQFVLLANVFKFIFTTDYNTNFAHYFLQMVNLMVFFPYFIYSFDF